MDRAPPSDAIAFARNVLGRCGDCGVPKLGSASGTPFTAPSTFDVHRSDELRIGSDGSDEGVACNVAAAGRIALEDDEDDDGQAVWTADSTYI